MIRERVVPIRGDLVLEGLGLDPKVRSQLIEEVNVIFNTAASINFDDPIREALMINYFGARRVLDLAHECKRLSVLHHVSTAYVSSNMPTGTTAMEEIVPFSGNWEEMIDTLMRMEPQKLESYEPIILKKHGFANTYTMTKNLAE